MTNTKDNENSISKAGPHNGGNIFITILIITLLAPLAIWDFERWDRIINEAKDWNWIKSREDKKQVKSFIDNKYYSNRFKKEAVALHKKIVQKEYKKRIAQIRTNMKNKIRYLKLLKPDKNNDAIQIQKLLTLHGYYNGSYDGLVGKSTQEAIYHFRKDHNLPVKGKWDIKTQVKLQLLTTYKGSDILNVHSKKSTKDIIEGSMSTIAIKNNPTKAIPEMLNMLRKKYKRKFITVIDIIRIDNRKIRPFVVFRKWGKLVAYRINGEKYKLTTKMISRIRKIEKTRSQKGKMIKTELIIAIDPKKLVSSSYSKGFDMGFHNVYLRKSGQTKQWRKTTFITLAKDFSSELFVINGKFNRVEFIKSIVAPETVKARLYYPVYSDFNGRVKLASIRVNIDSKPDNSEIQEFSVNVVNKHQTPIATYSNIVYLRPGPVKKGDFFALSLYNDPRISPRSPDADRKPYFQFDIDQIRLIKHNKSRNSITKTTNKSSTKKIYTNASLNNGKKLYSISCSACHQKNGKGLGPFPDITKSRIVKSGTRSILKIINNPNQKTRVFHNFNQLKASELRKISRYVFNTFGNQ